jgi:hypothetical protein
MIKINKGKESANRHAIISRKANVNLARGSNRAWEFSAENVEVMGFIAADSPFKEAKFIFFILTPYYPFTEVSQIPFNLLKKVRSAKAGLLQFCKQDLFRRNLRRVDKPRLTAKASLQHSIHAILSSFAKPFQVDLM